MRKKRFFRRAVYEYPEQLYVPERDVYAFRSWIDKLRQGKSLVMEIGIGTGDFLVEYASQHPDSFFLGVEIKPDRIYRALEKARSRKITNIAFLQAPVQKLKSYNLPKCEKLIMLFPDPWPKERHENKRMTSPGFLKMYRSLLRKKGLFFFKTDNEALFRYSHETLKRTSWNISHFDENHQTELSLRTAYEKRYRDEGKPIYHLHALQPPLPFSLRKVFAPLIHWVSRKK